MRKAVPEGYKTGTYSAPSIFLDTRAPISPEADIPNRYTNFSGTRPVSGSYIRELAPFCGINKVGGFAQQFPASHENYLVNSQESNASTISLDSVAAGKRRFDDEDEEDETASFLQGDLESRQRGEPKSRPTGLGIHGRAMAIPKTRRKRMEGWDQGNAMDFEEADFLDYGHLNEPEVEMNDV